jgi:hypothetical protein
MLPITLSEVLGISLSEVMNRYFDGSDEETRVHRIEGALDRKITHEEGELWLIGEARRRSLIQERFIRIEMTLRSSFHHYRSLYHYRCCFRLFHLHLR